MKYFIETIGGKEYKLRLTAQETLNTEKRMGCSLLKAVENMEENIDVVGVTTNVLHGALQAYQHGMTFSESCNLYDEMVDEGKGLDDMMNLVMEILKVSGFLKDDQMQIENESEEEKNE